jgi:predicted outer membrane lipoprotein
VSIHTRGAAARSHFLEFPQKEDPVKRLGLLLAAAVAILCASCGHRRHHEFRAYDRGRAYEFDRGSRFDRFYDRRRASDRDLFDRDRF